MVEDDIENHQVRSSFGESGITFKACKKVREKGPQKQVSFPLAML
jgi:hypothetical protein